MDVHLGVVMDFEFSVNLRRNTFVEASGSVEISGCGFECGVACGVIECAGVARESGRVEFVLVIG